MLAAMGLENVWLLFAGSMTAGFAAPVLLHLAALRFRATRRLVLGLR